MIIDIVLATYNGAAYLRQQLDSLLAQDMQDFRILVRDDLSTDATPAIIGEYAAAHPDKFFLVSPSEKLGAAQNFACLLTLTEAPYISACDQDDIWHRDKLSRQLAVMREVEQRFNAPVPLLVHGDARMIDGAGNVTGSSFMHAQKLAPKNALLPRLLVQNHVLGCAMLMNRPLLALALPVPTLARMHDHWIALTAAACGSTAYISEPLLDYRQHGGNAIGLKARSLSGFRNTARRVMEENVVQAAALTHHLQAHLPMLSAWQLTQFLKISRLPAPARAGAMLAGGYMRSPWWQNAALLAV